MFTPEKKNECVPRDTREPEKEAKWNNKFNRDKDAKPCSAFNNGVTHNAFQLKADGSCRFGHVCDHWVSDKGPGAQVPRFGGY